MSSYQVYVVRVKNSFIVCYFYSCLQHVSGIALCLLFSNKYVEYLYSRDGETFSPHAPSPFDIFLSKWCDLAHHWVCFRRDTVLLERKQMANTKNIIGHAVCGSHSIIFQLWTKNDQLETPESSAVFTVRSQIAKNETFITFTSVLTFLKGDTWTGYWLEHTCH